MTLRLLQVCNVGQIVGGTAACAWTVVRSLPAFEHVIAFLGPIAPDTQAAFAGCRLESWPDISAARVRSVTPHIVLLHNTSPRRVRDRWPVPTVLYRHSAAPPAQADVVLYCSRWLAARCRTTEADVLWQAVPRPRPLFGTRTDRELTIGRICTPQSRKWPADAPDFYRELARAFPRVRWEFVGCPAELQPRLQSACAGRAVFWPAGWEQRARLHTWHALLYSNPQLPESFGRTVAEAMRAGCIPIVDRLGGFVEQLDVGGGSLCATSADFLCAVAELHEPELRRRLSDTARRVADERCALARFARELLQRFDQAAARAAGGAAAGALGGRPASCRSATALMRSISS